MIEHYMAGGGLRLCQIIIYASLWILIGCFTAAIFRRMLGPQKVKRLFADETRWGLLVGWLIGMLLPVCSLGVIPIVRELHRAGVKRGSIVAFGLTAPLFNPMSVLYGLTLSDPIAILSFSLCALCIVSLLGWVWGRWQANNDQELADQTLPSPGIKSSVAVFYTASKEMIGPTIGYVAVGILASVLLAVLFPKGYLQSEVERDNLFAPITVGLIATPIYSTPLLAMSQIGGMFQHGNSIGAAFSLLILGAGTNLGLFCWFGVTYGWRQVALFFLLLLTVTVGLAYAIDKPLYPKGVEPAGHSHAFDVYTHPYGAQQPSLIFQAKTDVVDFWQDNEFGGTYLLLFLVILGIIFAISGMYFDYESWFCSANRPGSKLNAEVPGWILGMTTVVGLVIASIVGCYLYYPAPNDLLRDLSDINTEAVLCSRTKDWEAAEKWIGYSDDLSRRLEVGVFLRHGSVSDFKSAKAKVYRQKLDKLKEAVEARNPDQIVDQAMDVSNAYLQMSLAFKEDGQIK